MATWWTTSNYLSSLVSDRIGYKSGLALSREEIIDHLDAGDVVGEAIKTYSDEMIRIRTDKIEDAFQILLFRLGVISKPFVGHAPTLLCLEYANDKVASYKLNIILRLLGETHFDIGKRSITDGFDRDKFMDLVKTELPEGGLFLAEKLIDLTEQSEEASLWEWFNARSIDWIKPVDLRALFESESLNAMYGTFFDQRYIDYLASNFDLIGEMNWRKFEALTAEYFCRLGYDVELGAGRNDGGIDVRVWKKGNKGSEPPITLVQCKRENRKIGKVIVKSLWADVVHEHAESGLIVTTSSLAPGAESVCKARSYPVKSANRENLKEWLNQLRTPGKGAFLGN